MVQQPERRIAGNSTAELFVLDGSVVLAWFFADESSPYADSVAVSFARAQAIVPVLWRFEIANALIVGERRKRSTEAQASGFLSRLSQLSIILDEQSTAEAWPSTITLARKLQLSAYDAAYLEVALRRAIPIATLDKRLGDAANNVGIAIYKP